MRTILFLSLFILCASILVTAQENIRENAEENDPANDELETDLQEVPLEEAKEQMEADEDNAGIASKETAEAEDIKLNFNRGKGITLTLTPDGNGGSSGTTYTRWGRTVCPRGATRVYEGYAAAGRYNQPGNGANLLCMTKQPRYLSTTNIPWPSCLYPGEYRSNNQVFSRTRASRTQNYNIPCAVCHIPRSTHIMMPGTVACPSKWKREYYGYIMAGHMSHHQTVNYACVDYTPEVVPGTSRNTNAALLYFLQMECGYGIPCGGSQYIQRRAITCAICTK